MLLQGSILDEILSYVGDYLPLIYLVVGLLALVAILKIIIFFADRDKKNKKKKKEKATPPGMDLDLPPPRFPAAGTDITGVTRGTRGIRTPGTGLAVPGSPAFSTTAPRAGPAPAPFTPQVAGTAGSGSGSGAGAGELEQLFCTQCGWKTTDLESIYCGNCGAELYKGA